MKPVVAKLLSEDFNGHSRLSDEEYFKVINFNLKMLLEAAAVIYSFLTNKLGLDYPVIELNGDSQDFDTVRRYVNSIENSNVFIEFKKNRHNATFSDLLGKANLIWDVGFSYSFSDADLKRVQELVNELREQISVSELFEEEHRQRLLRRLERLQSELHKKMSDLDRFWGFVGDAGVVIGKLGKDAKPFVDRIRELGQLAWGAQAEAEKLPSSTPNPFSLEDKSEE